MHDGYLVIINVFVQKNFSTRAISPKKIFSFGKTDQSLSYAYIIGTELMLNTKLKAALPTPVSEHYTILFH